MGSHKRNCESFLKIGIDFKQRAYYNSNQIKNATNGSSSLHVLSRELRGGATQSGASANLARERQS
ncbi:hypothetical protein PN4B1_23160 [Paenibacillus naphthalenovorans]|nr:hypothetical protein PN4B1_23160 [Paenibacillus naphthalenovorans]